MICRKCDTGMMVMGLNALDWRRCQICTYTIPARETMLVKPKKLSKKTKVGLKLVMGGHLAEVTAVNFPRKEFTIKFFDFDKL